MKTISRFLREADTQKNNKLQQPPRQNDTVVSKQPGADLYAVTEQPNSGLKEDYRGPMTQIVYSKKTKRVTLQRYLSSKIAFFPEDTTFSDILVLYDNLLWLQDKSIKDPQFREKFGIALEALAKLLKGTKISEKTVSKTVRKLSKQFKDKLEGFLYPKRNVKQIGTRARKSFRLQIPKQPGTKNSELPPKQYIGRGYDDKGTARDSAKDGSPSWQEVASSKINECEIQSGEDQ